jgi:hypothetical protein
MPAFLVGNAVVYEHLSVLRFELSAVGHKDLATLLLSKDGATNATLAAAQHHYQWTMDNG